MPAAQAAAWCACADTLAPPAPPRRCPGLAASDLRGFFSTANAAAAAGDEPVFSPAAAAAAAIAAAGGEATPEQVQAVAAALAEFDRNQTTTSGDVGSSDVCPVANGSNGSPKLLVWPPFDPRFLLFQSCFYHVMRLNYIRATNTCVREARWHCVSACTQLMSPCMLPPRTLQLLTKRELQRRRQRRQQQRHRVLCVQGDEQTSSCACSLASRLTLSACCSCISNRLLATTTSHRTSAPRSATPPVRLLPGLVCSG